MNEITKEEAANLEIRVGRMSVVRTKLMNMKPGNIVFIEKADFKIKNKTPATHFSNIQKKHNMTFSCKTLADGSGWIVERLK